MPLPHSSLSRSATELREAFPAQLLLSAIVDSSDDAIISKALDGTIASWNRGAERVFGYTEHEMVGQSVLRLIPPDLHHEEAMILGRLRRGERIDHYESVRQRKDGTRIHVSLTISPLRDPSGRIVGASKVARDVTRDRKAEEAMRLLAAIVDSSDDAIVSKNLQGIVTSWNRGAERIFGYTAEEMIGRPVSTLFPLDRLDEEPRILERLRRGERVDHYQTIRQRKDGRLVDVSVTISPIRNPSGEIVGASKVARDITDEKRAVAALARANEELKRADRMKSEFLAIMSHELRTPLNSILGFAAVLRQGRSGPINEEQRNHLNLIHASGKSLLGLINDLLDVSRIEAGRAEIQSEIFSPADVIKEVVRTLEPQAAQKKLHVRQNVDAAEPITSDRRRFYQVMLNLLNNAIKFTPRGGVEVRAANAGDRLVVSVADTGIGISKAEQGELFKAFNQLEASVRRRYEGTGLGLYLCKRIVNLLGGEIGVESEPHRGSVFTFWIPVRPPAEQPAAREAGMESCA